MEKTAENVDLIKTLVFNNCGIWSWELDTNLNVIKTNCPNPNLMSKFMVAFRNKEYLSTFIKQGSTPLVMNDYFHMMWLVCSEKQEESMTRLHVLGPIYAQKTSSHTICTLLENLHINELNMKHVMRCMQRVPVYSANAFLPFGAMLHELLNGEHILISEFCFGMPSKIETIQSADRKVTYGSWSIEQGLLQMIRDGNDNFQQILNRAMLVGGTIASEIQNPVRRLKNSTIVFATLCAHAAIDGGLMVSSAYKLRNYYIDRIEQSITIGQIINVNHEMYKDFISQVRKRKDNIKISRIIQDCCEYIDIHMDQNVRIKELADMIGYADYYLTRKFKREVGISINEYIKKAKLSYAKYLLETTYDSITQISERLHFCNGGYFTSVFRKMEGITPSEYRTNVKKKRGIKNDD